MKITIERAELCGDTETKAKYVRYKGKKYDLKSKDWEEAKKEAKELLFKIYGKNILIG